jgi:hypothetical protein
MNGFEETNNPCSDDGGGYMAACEAVADAFPPNGWAKWIIPTQTYFVVPCSTENYGQIFADFAAAISGHRRGL